MHHQLHQQRAYRRRTRWILLLLAAWVALFTFPYLVYNVSLIRPCSVACMSRRLAAALGSEDPRLRVVDCTAHGNATTRLLRQLGRWVNLTRSPPIYHWLDQPVDVSATCLDLPLPPLPPPGPPGSNSDGCFNQTIPFADKAQAYDVLHRIQQNFSQRGLQIFLSDGSLIGSVRHFGIIPWDDDVDMLILREQKFEVRELLVALSHQDEFSFTDTESVNFHWRFSFLCQPDRSKPQVQLYGLSRLFPEKQCRMALDLFFADLIGDQLLRPEMPYAYSTRDIYPLRLLPFGPRMLWGPANPRAVLATGYGRDFEFSCMFQIHSELFRCAERFLECARLRRLYPFVTHARIRLWGRDLLADILVWRSQALAVFVPPQTL